MHKEFDDTKGIIRIHQLKKKRKHNDQKKTDKKRSHVVNLKFQVYSSLSINYLYT